MSESIPEISVITVTLNAGGRLARTVRSIDAQSFKAFEHIIKDGGSTDGSLDGIPSSPRRRIVVAPDSGIYDAMNQGLTECRGRYVVFLNAGDEFTRDDILERVAGELQCRDVDILYADILNSALGVVVRFPDRLSSFFLFRNTVCHQACTVRRELFEGLGGFDTTLSICADHDLLTRAIRSAGARSAHLRVAAVAYEGGGFSDKNRERLTSEFAVVRRRHWDPAQRVAFRAIHALSLPSLRRRLMTSPKLLPVARWYIRVRNALYSGGSDRRQR